MCECKCCRKPIESARQERFENACKVFNEKIMKLSLEFTDETGVRIQDIIIKFAEKK